MNGSDGGRRGWRLPTADQTKTDLEFCPLTMASDSASATVVVSNKLGLHARPAMALVDTANGFKSDITIHKSNQTVDAKSIMQVMMLAATQGTELQIAADGPDAAEAVAAIEDLVNRKFDEE